MLDNTNLQNGECGTVGLGQKLKFLLIGCGIGAGFALLFAPKSGRELRASISDVVTDGYLRTVESANQLKATAADYYETATETGNEVLDVVTSGMGAVGKEIRSDVERINEIVASKREGRMRSENIL